MDGHEANPPMRSVDADGHRRPAADRLTLRAGRTPSALHSFREAWGNRRSAPIRSARPPMFPVTNLIVASALDAPFRLGVGSSPAHFTHSDLTVSGRSAPRRRASRTPFDPQRARAGGSRELPCAAEAGHQQNPGEQVFYRQHQRLPKHSRAIVDLPSRLERAEERMAFGIKARRRSAIRDEDDAH